MGFPIYRFHALSARFPSFPLFPTAFSLSRFLAFPLFRTAFPISQIPALLAENPRGALRNSAGQY
jgi:hypothetical protein